MRISVMLAVVGLLVASCADDVGSDSGASTTTTTTATTSSTSSSTTTTSTTSTTTSSSTTTSTTTTSSTTSVPTSTVATDPFVPPAEFTTNEMVEARAGTHTYLGGWTITPEFDAAVEQWIEGTDAGQWYATGGEMEIWVLDLVRHTTDGRAVWNRTDLLVVEVGANLNFSSRCRIDGEPVDGVFATTMPDEDEQWIPALTAWRVDLDTLVGSEIDAGPVVCENESYGL